MNMDEREYSILEIRSGKICLNIDNKKLYIHAPTIDNLIKSSIIYKYYYKKCQQEGIMTNEEMEDWLLKQNLWNYDDENDLKICEKNIEKFKLALFNNYSNKVERKRNKTYIDLEKKKLQSLYLKKNQYFINTCEGISLSQKTINLIKNTCYFKQKKINYKQFSIIEIVDKYHESLLQEPLIRQLARNELWKSLWSIRNNSGVKLFYNTSDQELLPNQKNLIIWSQIYDNIQESIDCPSIEIINDDDALDGWFINQKDKNKHEESNKKIKNSKISNSAEVFYFTNDPEEREEIFNLNTEDAKRTIKNRFKFIDANKDKIISHSDFPDQKLAINMQKTQNMIKHNKGI